MHTTLKLRRQSPPVTIFYDLRKWCYLAALLSTDHHKIRLLQGLEDFDSKVDDLNQITLVQYNPRKRGILWHLLYHLIYTVGTNVVSFTFFYPTNKPFLGLVFDLLVKTFAGEMGFVNTIVNVVFCSEICYRYRLITTSWVYHKERLKDTPVARVVVQERCRLLHAQLTDLADLLSLCYGRFYVVNLFFVFLESMMFLYRIILVQSQIAGNVQSVLYLVVNVASVPVLACSTSSIIIAVSGNTVTSCNGSSH
ncbi:uncharacterized protein LOC128989260 [Macrosteles quadrilineatus]|uniref:uncharacterized protein LOC128989260 n=1 Tax=Macrosteles quadrilineatus TaxID=74068 RepID=UPI0023E19938|nr:uncharacterized protein LOC128989260 [Macrosteles quadrilineatus]